jgi:hypothetical protein
MEANAGDGSPKDALCPSAPPSADAVILAVVGDDGGLAYVRPALPVGPLGRDFESGGAGSARFAAPCLEGGCTHWRDQRCNLVDTLVSRSNETPRPNGAPRCSIRAMCRWFRQDGWEACSACPRVRRNDLIAREDLERVALSRSESGPSPREEP